MFTRTTDFYSPDCDHVPLPVPRGGKPRGRDRLRVRERRRLPPDRRPARAEAPLRDVARRTSRGGTEFHGGCLAVWDLDAHYGPTPARRAVHRRADAGGFPIAPLLFTADEVAAGRDRPRDPLHPAERPHPRRLYVPPATHCTGPTTGGANAAALRRPLPPAADFRLSSLPNEGARVVARALQRYGMFLADGGNIALTVASDRYSTAKWSASASPTTDRCCCCRSPTSMSSTTARRPTGRPTPTASATHESIAQVAAHMSVATTRGCSVGATSAESSRARSRRGSRVFFHPQRPARAPPADARHPGLW